MLSTCFQALTTFFVESCLYFCYLASITKENTMPQEETKSSSASGRKHKHTNRLIHETSPYLRQHAHNPVDWYPWGEDALKESREKDKPILLSIGYSACHWCHVMEHESFENEDIARLMNENFVCIKVDREERPDLDDIYMKAVQLMTGQGGWPMTTFLMPEGEPFYGGTYYPPVDRGGMPGFPRVLESVAAAYKSRKEDVRKNAQELTQAIRTSEILRPSKEILSRQLVKNGARMLLRFHDTVNGGFGSAPKFPHALDLMLLLRAHRITQEENMLNAVELTLRKMAEGGVYDQLGGGFHRYSVDEVWLVPHFEKMLYDNALLTRALLETYQVTGREFYKEVAGDILRYVMREMTHEEGGFYSAQDADSEGEEGKYFVWTPDEIKNILGERDGEFFCRVHGVEKYGNFEQGKSILHLKEPMELTAQRENTPFTEFQKRINALKEKLFTEREKRIKQGLDDKILTSWNGLMLSAFAFAYQALGEKKYLDAAEKCAQFFTGKMMKDGKLLHTYKEGQAKLNAYLDDYTFLTAGFLDLYEACYDITWLERARTLAEKTIELFWDDKKDGLFFTSHDHEKLIARQKNFVDNVVPSGNSVAVLNLLRLWCYTADEVFYDRAQKTLRLSHDLMRNSPNACSLMLCALDFYLEPPKEAVLAGKLKDEQTQSMLKELRKCFLPNKVTAVVDGKNSGNTFALFKNKFSLDGKTTAYICTGGTCRKPVNDAAEFLTLLEGEFKSE